MTATLELVADFVNTPEASNVPEVTQDSTIVSSLDRAIQAIEGAFLAAGNALSDAVDGVGELIAGLDRLTAAIDPEMVASTTDDLKRAAASLHEIPEALARRRVGLEGLVALGGDLGASVTEMKRSLGYLRVFTVYVKVAAAGIPDDGQQFTAFAGEIADCIGGGRSHVEAFDDDLEALDRTLRAALRVEGELAIHCADLLPSTPNAIVATASELSGHRNKIAQAAISVRTLASGVRSKVGKVLAALQVGDMTRQRLEHVRDGLTLLGTEARDLADEPRARFLALGREFLNALLTSAAEDFDCEIRMIGRNMEGLAGDAVEVLNLLDAAYGRGEGGEDGFVGHLESHVGVALGLVGQVQAAEDTAAVLGRSAADAALRLIARIDDIQRLQRDVQNMALNTRLKCSQIGSDGKSLAVIALELREQALHLEGAATRALTHIGELERGAGLLAGAVDPPGEAGAKGAASALNKAVERLQSAGGNLQADQAALGKLGGSVVRGLQQAASGIDFKMAVGASLDEALEAMSRSVGSGTPGIDDIRPQVVAFLDQLARGYTMAQERNIHQVIAAAFCVPAGEGPVEDAAAVAEDLDDLLF